MTAAHGHAHGHGHEHGHGHGLVARSIVSSRAGLRAVGWSLLVLALTALLQLGVFVLTDSIALLADLIHNFGDALTAVPLGIAFLLRSFRAEKRAGYFVVATIFVSACVALWQSIERLVNPQQIEHLWPLAAAGVIGFLGNEIAAQIRTSAGRRLDSPALIADGAHARTDGVVSLSVVASSVVVALGLQVGDPIIGLIITLVILRITWQSFVTVQREPGGERQAAPDGNGHGRTADESRSPGDSGDDARVSQTTGGIHARMPEGLELRRASEADLPWVRDLACREDVAASLSTTAADGLADSVAAGELWIAETPARERVGAVRITVVNRRSRIASIETLMVHPDARGRRLGVAILRAVSRDAFERGVHRLEGEVYDFNVPALRTFEAAGFTREGVRRRAYHRHGAWQDGVRFGLLADE